WQRSIKSWTVTTNGPLASRYFIRLSKTGDPNAAITYNVGNGGPDLDQRSVVDAGFLELTRLGELPASDPDVLASLPVVDATIRSDTPSGPGWHRYTGDGYGGPAGSAAPLTWSAASFVRLARDLREGALVDRPAATFDRYVAHRQGTTALTVTAPAAGSAVLGSPVTVSGTSNPGNTVFVAA